MNNQNLVITTTSVTGNGGAAHSGLDLLLNNSDIWRKIMDAYKHHESSDFSPTHHDRMLSDLIPTHCLENLPHRESVTENFSNKEIELNEFMKAAGLVYAGATFSSPATYEEKRGGFSACSTSIRRGKGESSPTNVAEIPVCLQDSCSPNSLDCSKVRSRSSKRKDSMEGMSPSAIHNEDTMPSKRVRARDWSSHPSPARTPNCRYDLLFSPNRQQAATNLVGLKKNFGSFISQ